MGPKQRFNKNTPPSSVGVSKTWSGSLNRSSEGRKGGEPTREAMSKEFTKKKRSSKPHRGESSSGAQKEKRRPPGRAFDGGGPAGRFCWEGKTG